MVEGTPLLREHAAYTRIEGSNPSISARMNIGLYPANGGSTPQTGDGHSSNPVDYTIRLYPANGGRAFIKPC